MVRTLAICLVMCLAGISAREAWALDPYVGNDPYWILLHEPAVMAELKLTPAQRRSVQALTDGLDLRFLPFRNKPADVAQAGMIKIITEAREGVNTILQPAQRRRLNEILLRKMGNTALQTDAVAGPLRYSDAQRQRIKEINETTQAAVTALQKEVNEGKPRGPLEKKFNELQVDQQKQLVDVLTAEQQLALKKLLGSPFELSKLGQPAFKAPELIDTGEWINSTPLKLENLRGKVVVLHFYACGCINCIHNYPWYKEWHERFKDKNVVLIGIHTPETASERDSANVRRKAGDEKFAFPILIDGKNENWNAWGNSMWPAVYVIDKRGYLREFWPGELKWQGNDGEKYMRERIERLLVGTSPIP
jgi:peroxiredoxin